MYNKAIKEDPWFLTDVPDWFVTRQKIKIWHDNDDYCDYDEIIECFEGYQKRKSQKAQIKKELMLIA